MRRLLALLFLVVATQGYVVYITNKCATEKELFIVLNDETNSTFITLPPNLTFMQSLSANDKFSCEEYGGPGQKGSRTFFVPGPLLPPLLQLTTEYFLGIVDRTTAPTQLKPRCLLGLCPTLTCISRGQCYGGTQDAGLIKAAVLAGTDFDLTYCATL